MSQGSSVASGAMRERVTIQKGNGTSDGAGGSVRSWSDYRTVWAEVLPVGGREQAINGVLEAVQSYMITMRYREDLVPADRLSWRGRLLNIRSASDPDGRRRCLTVYADTGVNTA